MKVSQISTIMNAITGEVLGNNALVQEDLSNIVTVGKEIIDSDNIDNYVKKLVNQIGKIVFVDRLYVGSAPSVLIDAWEYGSILEKVSADLPAASDNSSWDLTNGTSYGQDVFYKPAVTVKLFNHKTTFDIPMSFTERQVKESFSSAEQMNGFLSMLTNAVENSMTIQLDELIMRSINNMIGEVLDSDLGVGEAPDHTISYGDTGVKAVNLLKLYNTAYNKTLTPSAAITDADFIRYATYIVSVYSDRMSKISTLFNVDGKERFTPKEYQKVVLLSDFAKASETFLSSNTYNSEKVALPAHDAVPFWQGSGVGYSFEDVSKIKIKTVGGAVVETSGVLGVMFDQNALGVCNLDRRVTTYYNAKAEFYTNFYKFDAGFYNDLSENFVVFFVASAS